MPANGCGGFFFFFQAEDGIRDYKVTGVQTCALPISHARDELGISETLSARPLQAAMASAGSFAVGAAMPLAVVLLAPEQSLLYWIVATAIVFLALLGAAAAAVGGTADRKSVV